MAHRSYQPILPCGNKLLQKRWDETYFEEHRRRLRSAKCVVDTTAPARRSHVTAKLKKQQVDRERTDEIERDNLHLLKRMQRIMKTEGGVDHRNTYRHHSLNDLKRQRELERVAEENKTMLKRLQEVKPQYSVTHCVEHWRKNAELVEMLTSYPSVSQHKTSPSQQKKHTSSTGSAPPHQLLVEVDQPLPEDDEQPSENKREEERAPAQQEAPINTEAEH